MQALIELLAGFIVLLATAALAQFGVILDKAPEQDREIHRVADCAPPAPAGLIVAETTREC